MIANKMIKPTNRWNAKLKRERISNAIANERLKKEGWSIGKRLDHFGVDQTTLKRWSKLVSEEVKE